MKTIEIIVQMTAPVDADVLTVASTVSAALASRPPQGCHTKSVHVEEVENA